MKQKRQINYTNIAAAFVFATTATSPINIHAQGTHMNISPTHALQTPSSTKNSRLTKDNIDQKLSELSLDQKIGQIIIAPIFGSELTSEKKDELKRTKLGNIISFNWGGGLENPAQIQKLFQDVQNHMIENCNGIPALIAIDQEGGIVARLKGNNGFTEFSGNMALAATADPNLAKQAAFEMGKEMTLVGINMSLAPVVDVNNNPKNPVINVRSFGDNAEEVTQFAQAAIDGFHQAGVLTTLKHFPGHGDTDTDTHKTKTKLHKDIDELEQCELKPFISLIPSCDAIMSAHIFIPKIDADNCASCSKILLTDMLRKKYGFEGVIVSDALVMKGVAPKQNSLDKAFKSVSKAAKRAFKAGSDLLILARLEGAAFPEAESASTTQALISYVTAKFKKSVAKGKISENQINDSVRRILTLKSNISTDSLVMGDLTALQSEKAKKLSQEIATKALTLLSSKELFDEINTSIIDRKVTLIAPEGLKGTVQRALKKFPEVMTYFFTEETAEDRIRSKEAMDKFNQFQQKTLQTCQEADMTIFLSFNGNAGTPQRDLLDTAAYHLPPKKLIVAALRKPQDVATIGLPGKHLTYLTYSPTQASIEALLDALQEHRLPTGVSPMHNLVIEYGKNLNPLRK